MGLLIISFIGFLSFALIELINQTSCGSTVVFRFLMCVCFIVFLFSATAEQQYDKEIKEYRSEYQVLVKTKHGELLEEKEKFNKWYLSASRDVRDKGCFSFYYDSLEGIHEIKTSR